jgi:hypothetical protein
LDSLKPECALDGCARTPTHYCLLKVPAVGYPDDRAVKLTMGVVLCRDHANEAVPADFLGDEGKRFLSAVLAAQRLAPPDFARASVEVRRIGDDNWREFIAQRAVTEGGETA